ncbi:hypothetical protein TMatcc_003749 [Talaromyces marneffei ATCC 18224]
MWLIRWLYYIRPSVEGKILCCLLVINILHNPFYIITCPYPTASFDDIRQQLQARQTQDSGNTRALATLATIDAPVALI